MDKFKVGDKVYHPRASRKVLTLEGNDDSPYSVSIDLGSRFVVFTPDGYYSEHDVLPSIFHATKENKAKLEAFYGGEFEAPYIKPTPKEIIKAMFARGDKYVLCLVADKPRQIAEGNGVRVLVTAVIDDAIFCFRTAYHDWRYAIPIDQQRNEIMELPT